MSDETLAYGKGENLNDPLTLHAEGAGVWGLPSDTDREHGAELAPEHFDYSAGMFVGVPGQEADAVPGTLHPLVVAKLATDQPYRSYETIHEATHRRYDAPFNVAINQAAAGYTMVQPPKPGLHFLKVLAAFITLDAAGTLQLVQGDEGGLNRAAITGLMNLGGAATPAFQLPPSTIETPWFYLTPDLALGIVTVTGKAQGFLTCCFSPYDA